MIRVSSSLSILGWGPSVALHVSGVHLTTDVTDIVVCEGAAGSVHCKAFDLGCQVLLEVLCGCALCLQAVAQAVLRDRAGLSSRDRGSSFLFLGPTGETVILVQQAVFSSVVVNIGNSCQAGAQHTQLPAAAACQQSQPGLACRWPASSPPMAAIC